MLVVLQHCIPKKMIPNEFETNDSTKGKNVNRDLFEEDPSGEPVIDVKHLRKVFKSLTGKIIEPTSISVQEETNLRKGFSQFNLIYFY